ncbi:MAG: MFS transporter [Pseudomonadota bacterium]|nr:MFS transporter [Pseudomonadota bacterium]
MEHHYDDARARWNALVLSAAQALYGIGATILITLGGLTGHLLADDKSLATLPISTYVLGTALATVPASYVMHRIGRRRGFQLGAAASVLSGSLAVYAIYNQDFWLFCLGTALTGVYQAFVNYYRFAAADTASPLFRPKAVSWVLIGGVVAAIVGPQVVIWTKDAFAPVLFAGSFAASAMIAVVAMAVLNLVDIPRDGHEDHQRADARSLREILSQGRLLVAIACGMVSYASMNFMMTAAPLAMVACNHPVEAAAGAIRWHILAMFAPSFFTGNLIARFGREPVMLAGLGLLLGAGAVALSGIAQWQFDLALICLGVGWNFSFVGATTLVTDCHRPSERAKVQAVNDLLVFGLVSMASFASGKILHEAGWTYVALAILPPAALAGLLVMGLMVGGRSASNTGGKA